MISSFKVHYGSVDAVTAPTAAATPAANERRTNSSHKPSPSHKRMYPLHELYLVRDETGRKATLHTFGEDAAVHVGANNATEGSGCGEVAKMHLDCLCPTCGRHYTESDASTHKGRCVDCVLCPRCGVKASLMMKETFDCLQQCGNCGWCTQVFKGLNDLKMDINGKSYALQPGMKARHRTLENAHQLGSAHVVSISSEARGVRVYGSHNPNRAATTVCLSGAPASGGKGGGKHVSIASDVGGEEDDERGQSTLALLMSTVSSAGKGLDLSTIAEGLTNDSITSASSSTGYHAGMRILGNFSHTSIAATAGTRAAHTQKLEDKLRVASQSRTQGAPLALDVSTLATTALPTDFSEVSTGGRRHMSTFISRHKLAPPVLPASTAAAVSSVQGDGVFVNVMKFVGANTSISASTSVAIDGFGKAGTTYSYNKDLFTYHTPGKDSKTQHSALPTACVPTTIHPNITALTSCKRASSHILQQALAITSAQLYPSSLSDVSVSTAETPFGALSTDTKDINNALQSILPAARSFTLRNQGDMPGPSTQLIHYTPLISRETVILTHPLYSTVDASTALSLPSPIDVVNAVNAPASRSKAGGGGDLAATMPGSAYLYVPNPKGLFDSNTTGGLLNRDRNPHLGINMNAGRILPHVVLARFFEESSPRRSTTSATAPAAAEAATTTPSAAGSSSRLLMCYLWNFSGTDVKVTEIAVVGTKGCTAVCTCSVPTPVQKKEEEEEGTSDNANPQEQPTSSSPPAAVKPLTMFLTSRSNDIESLGSNNAVTARERDGLMGAAAAIRNSATTSPDAMPNPTFFPCESRVLFGVDVVDSDVAMPTRMVCLRVTAIVSVGRNAKVQVSYLSYLTFA